MTIKDDVEAIIATEDSINSAKRALTALLTVYVNEFNANASRTTLAISLTAYVHQFNVLTSLTNQLYTQVQKLDDDINTVELDANEVVTKVGLVQPVISFTAT